MRRGFVVVLAAIGMLAGSLTPAWAAQTPHPSRSADPTTSAPTDSGRLSARGSAVVDPGATSITAPFDGVIYAVAISTDALYSQSLALTQPASVPFCGGCSAGQTGAGGPVAKGAAITFTHNGHPSTDAHWTRLLDQSTVGNYATWTFGLEDQTPDTGDFNDLIAEIVVTNGAALPNGGALTARELLGLANGCLLCGAETVARGTAGDPIELATGALTESAVDDTWPARGLGMTWARTYSSSAAAENGPLGYGWKLSYDQHLSLGAAGSVTVVQETGAETTFTSSGNGYTAPGRVQASLTKNGDGTYTLVRRRSQTLVFDAGGHLTSVADRNGEMTRLTYIAGQLRQVTDAAGRALSVTWTDAHITKISDPLNRSVSYGYDAQGNLASVTATDGAVTTYSYDAAHRMTGMLDPVQQAATTKKPVTTSYASNGKVTNQVDPNGFKTTFAYAGDPFSAAGGSTVVIDPQGHKRLETYQYGLRTSLVLGVGTPTETSTSFGYDPVSLAVVSTTTVSKQDTIVHTVARTVDAHGNALTTTDGAGRVTTQTFNAFDEPLTITTPNPSDVGPATVTATRTYDPRGNLLSVHSPLYASASESTDAAVSLSRDDAAHPGDVTAVRDPLGRVTAYAFDAAGDTIKVTSPGGRITTATFDAVGRRLSVTSPRGNATGATPARFTTTFSYDRADRLLSTSVASGPAPLVTSTTYDADGRAVSTTDALNKITTMSYDLDGRLTKVTRPDGSTQLTSYFNDDALQSQTDGLGNKTATLTEDALSRPAAVADQAGNSTAYTYDATGAVATVKDPLGQVTTNTYGPDGLLTNTAYSDGVTPGVTRTYNAAGLPATMKDGSGTTTWSYDSLGRLTATATPQGTVRHTYDLAGQPTSISYPSGNQVKRAFGPDGQLVSVTDWAERTSTFGYDLDLHLTGVTTPNGVTTANAFDDAGRITNTTMATPAATLLNIDQTRDAASRITQEIPTPGTGRIFTYDALGRLTKDGVDGAIGFSYDKGDNPTALGSVSQTFNGLNQVTSAKTAALTRNLAYDKRGDRTSLTVGTAKTTYAYDQVNRLTSVSGAATATYTYDGNGLRVSKTAGANPAETFTYDTGAALPLLLTDGDTSYIYGPTGTPIEKIAPDGTPTYLHADQLGSVRLLTNQTGASLGTATYSAYGTPTTTGSTTPFGFAGQYTDIETGFQYLRARYYDPSTAQFLTPDPLQLITRARYVYASGNPVSSADPTGLLDIDWDAVATVAAGTGLVLGAGAACILGGCEAAALVGGAVVVADGVVIAAGAVIGAAGGIAITAAEQSAASGQWLNEASGGPDSSNCDDRAGQANTVAKGESSVWKNLQPWRGKTKTNGLNGRKQRYYEWDHTHGDIEVYDRNGKHLGSMDPTSGEMTKPPVPGRVIDVS